MRICLGTTLLPPPVRLAAGPKVSSPYLPALPQPTTADDVVTITTPVTGREGETPVQGTTGRFPMFAAHLGLMIATTLLPVALAVGSSLAASAQAVAPRPSISATRPGQPPTSSRSRAGALLAPTSAHMDKRLERVLSKVPSSVLNAVHKADTRIWVVPAGTRHLPASFLREDGTPVAEIERAWRRWLADPGAFHGLMGMPDHRTAFVGTDGEVTVPDLVTGQMLSYGQVPTLHELALQWGRDLYGTDPTTLPDDLRSLERLLEVMNPTVGSATSRIPAGTELRLPVSAPYQGRAFSIDSLNLAAEINASLDQGELVRSFPFTGLIVVHEEALSPQAPPELLEALGRTVVRIIGEDPRYGFEHASALAGLAADAETSSLVDASHGDPVVFYGKAFAQAFATGSAAPAGAADPWAPARSLVMQDVQWLAQPPNRPSASPSADEGRLPAGEGCTATPGLQGAVRNEMLDEAALGERRVRNTAILQRMTTHETWTRHGDLILRDLGVLPPGLLYAAQEAGVRLHVQAAGDHELPATLLAEDAAGAWAETLPVRVAPHERLLLNGDDPIAPLPRAGQTLEDIARQRGASSPTEVAEYVARAAAINQHPAHLPLEEGQEVRLPDLHLYHGRRYTETTMRDLWHMNRSIGGSAGFFRYWEDGRQAPILMIKEQHLCEQPGQTSSKRVLLHEMGHVAQYLALRDPHGQHDAAMRELRASAARNPTEMLTTYSRVHPAEQFADAFEAYLTTQRPGLPASPDQADDAALQRLNPRLRTFIATELERLGR